MNKSINFISKHLSALLFTTLYLIIFLTLVFLESFVPETQIGIFLLMGSFILYGICLDFVLSKNTILVKSYKLFTQLLPLGFFVLLGLTFIYDILEKQTPDLFNYLIYVFLAAPFAIASFHHKTNSKKIIFSVIGTACVFSVYLYLTTLSKELNTTDGLTVYLIVFVLIIYAANSFNKLPFLGAILGIIDGIILFILYKYPVTSVAKVYGWDYDFMKNFEYMLILTIVVGILITVLSSCINPVQLLEANPNSRRKRS